MKALNNTIKYSDKTVANIRTMHVLLPNTLRKVDHFLKNNYITIQNL